MPLRPHLVRAEGRTSVVDKVVKRRVEPGYSEPLIEVEDQVAGRVLVLFLSDVALARPHAERMFTPVEAVRGQPAR